MRVEVALRHENLGTHIFSSSLHSRRPSPEIHPILRFDLILVSLGLSHARTRLHTHIHS